MKHINKQVYFSLLLLEKSSVNHYLKTEISLRLITLKGGRL